MKSIFVAALFAAAAAAQGVVISSPAPNATLSPGQQFTVEVDRPVRFDCFFYFDTTGLHWNVNF